MPFGVRSCCGGGVGGVVGVGAVGNGIGGVVDVGAGVPMLLSFAGC